jgi:L-fuculose-phosphate aldolase
MKYPDLRAEVVEVARAMNARGLNRGTSGNVSARVPEGMLLTPSAIPCDALDSADLLVLDLDGAVLEGDGKPSTEWRLHAAVLRARGEVSAVLHAHPPFCTTLACLRREIPPFHYMVAVAGGDTIQCAPYATFGTPTLAALAVASLEGRRACLLANHGMLALGGSPAAALELAVEVEALAEMYWRALQAGEPALLSPDEMAAVHEAFADYRHR